MSIPEEEAIKQLLASGREAEINKGIHYAYRRFEKNVRKTIYDTSNGRLSVPDVNHLCNVVWYSLWSNVCRGNYDSNGSLPAYLSRIAANQCRNFLRDQKRSKEFLPGEDWFFNDQTPASLLDPLELPPEKLRLMLTQRDLIILQSCMKEILTERDYDIVWSYYFDECSAREIADRYDGTSNWVRQRLFVCRRNLQDCRDSKKNE